MVFDGVRSSKSLVQVKRAAGTPATAYASEYLSCSFSSFAYRSSSVPYGIPIRHCLCRLVSFVISHRPPLFSSFQAIVYHARIAVYNLSSFISAVHRALIHGRSLRLTQLCTSSPSIIVEDREGENVQVSLCLSSAQSFIPPGAHILTGRPPPTADDNGFS